MNVLLDGVMCGRQIFSFTENERRARERVREIKNILVATGVKSIFDNDDDVDDIDLGLFVTFAHKFIMELAVLEAHCRDTHCALSTCQLKIDTFICSARTTVVVDAASYTIKMLRSVMYDKSLRE